MSYNKKTEKGKGERYNLLAKYFDIVSIEKVCSKYKKKDAAIDDIFDAFVALWTAERIYRGKAGVIPDPSPLDAFGLQIEMWYEVHNDGCPIL